jgi:colanic acid/amylovoran biosynthesis glycosyltransferase
MAQTVAYLIPEFPGQTHAFFVREINVLERLKYRVELLSTRRPASSLIVHSWSQEAIGRTSYLTPLNGKGVLSILRELARSGPRGWWRCLASIARADGVSLKGRIRLAGLVAMGARAASLASTAGCTHIHAHSCADSAHIAMFSSLLSGTTYSMTLHGPLEDYGPNQPEKWRNAAFALVITRRLDEEVREQLAGYLPPAVAIAPMGVDVDHFRRSGPYRPWDGSGPCRIFTCGRLNQVKGHDDLIRAVGMLATEGIDAHLHIAGASTETDEQFRRELEQLIVDLGLSDRVSLLGAVPEERVRDELNECHVFALASWHEPLGVAIMEAMAMEAPVVATAAGGVAELIDEGVEGILVPPRDPKALANALRLILREPTLAAGLGQAGRSRVVNEFHSGVSAETIARLLDAKPTSPSAKPSGRRTSSQPLP